MHSLMQAINRIFTEKHPFRFLFSRLLLRLEIDLNRKLVFDDELGVKAYMHASSAAHKIFIRKYQPALDIAVFKKYITRPTSIVFDVGANIGMFSVVAARLAPAGQVYAFEATMSTFSQMLQNFKLNNVTNIYPVYAAVSDQNGLLSFFEHKYSSEQNHIDTSGSSSTLVPAVRLASFNKQRDDRNIDFLKIDVEGAELQVLKSLGPDLQSVKVIYLEVCDRNSLKFNYSENELIRFLQSNGFTIHVPVLLSGELVIEEYTEGMQKGLNLIAVKK